MKQHRLCTTDLSGPRDILVLKLRVVKEVYHYLWRDAYPKMDTYAQNGFKENSSVNVFVQVAAVGRRRFEHWSCQRRRHERQTKVPGRRSLKESHSRLLKLLLAAPDNTWTPLIWWVVDNSGVLLAHGSGLRRLLTKSVSWNDVYDWFCCGEPKNIC